jgi:hypothetical protein
VVSRNTPKKLFEKTLKRDGGYKNAEFYADLKFVKLVLRNTSKKVI